MIRDFLIPLVFDVDGYIPKYHEEINSTIKALGGVSIDGYSPQVTADLGNGLKTFSRGYFFIRITTENDVDFSFLESKPDVVTLSTQSIVDNAVTLSSFGIDLTGVTINTPRKTIERRLFVWLQNQDRDLEQLSGRAGWIINGN